jgi:hypothetical protein
LGGKKLDKNLIINLISLKPPHLVGRALFFEDTIDVVEKAIKNSGYKVVRTTNKFAVDALNIVWGVGTHLFPRIQEFRQVASPKNTVIFNMEQIGGESDLISDAYISLLSDYVVFDYNYANIKALNERVNGDVRAFEFPLRPGLDLSPYRGKQIQIDCDCVFFGALSDCRVRALERVSSCGVNVRIVSGFGLDLSEQILRSKFVLNLHLHTSALFEVARVMRPLSHGIPVLSEISVMPRTVSWENSGVVFCEKHTFLEECVKLANDSRALLQQSRNALRFVTETPRGNEVDVLIKEVSKSIL